MPRDPEKFLFDMLSASTLLLEFAGNCTFDDYIQDRAFRSACERQLQIIGEALMQPSKLAPDTASKISDHERIIGFRHVLVHGYDSLNDKLVWHVIEDKLSTLHEEVQALLPQEEGES